MSTKLSIWSCTTKDKTAVYICQIVPQKLVYSSRFQWTPVDSDGFQGIIRIQAYSIGFLWNPTYSTRFQRIPVDSVLVKFIPSDSSGFHWIPEDTKDSMEVQSGCVWKSEVQHYASTAGLPVIAQLLLQNDANINTPRGKCASGGVVSRI
jgi:hypothetical protein